MLVVPFTVTKLDDEKKYVPCPAFPVQGVIFSMTSNPSFYFFFPFAELSAEPSHHYPTSTFTRERNARESLTDIGNAHRSENGAASSRWPQT